MCTCGWCVSAEPHVCSTDMKPMRAPRCLGVAAILSVVSAEVPVAAAIVGDDGVSALLVLAARNMPAEGRRAAVLDRTHDLHLIEADVAGIGTTPRRSVVAEDIRDLQRWAGHGRGPLRR